MRAVIWILTLGIDSNGTTLSSSELWNGTSFFFTSSMNYARKDFTATLLLNGAVFIVGGNSGTGQLQSTEVFVFEHASSTTGTSSTGTINETTATTSLPSSTTGTTSHLAVISTQEATTILPGNFRDFQLRYLLS